MPLGSSQKVAITHDVLIHLGGAEKVLAELLRIHPQADVYTGFVSLQWLNNNNCPPEIKLAAQTGRLHSCQWLNWLNHFSISDSALSWFIPVISFYWLSLNLDSYDLIISSSLSFSAKSVRAVNVPHLAYIHSPPKYLYAEFSQHNWLKQFPAKIIFFPALWFQRVVDRLTAHWPTQLIANSQTVQERIERYYGLSAQVIHPPSFKFQKQKVAKGHALFKTFNLKKDGYYVFFSRIVEQKGIELAIQVCESMKVPLLVIGDGPLAKKMAARTGPLIHWVGFQETHYAQELISSAKCLIYPARDEDFGMSLVEAISLGTPAAAFFSGGAKEIVQPSINGEYFYEYTAKSLQRTLKKIDRWKQSGKYSAKICQKSVAKFSAPNFQKMWLELEKATQLKSEKLPTYKLLNTTVTPVTYDSVLKLIANKIKHQQKILVCPTPVHLLINAWHNNHLAAGLNSSAISVCDGMPLVWTSKKYGFTHQNSQRVYGPELTLKICELAAQKSWRVMVLAGRAGQAKRLGESLHHLFPRIKLAGQIDTISRPISPTKSTEIITKIKLLKPDIVLIGLGSPYQEEWSLNLYSKISRGCLVTIGAAVDFIGGHKPQAPNWMQNLGLEWLFRLCLEPMRLGKRYLWGNFEFSCLILIQFLLDEINHYSPKVSIQNSKGHFKS